MKKKRQLKVLMPEVLPDPRPATSPGGPRDRTLRRMQGLLALTAAGTSLAACSRESTDADADARRAQAAASSSVVAPAATTEKSTQIPRGPARPPRGYGVVDPMPPPVRCYTVGSGAVSARWIDRKTLEVRFPKPGEPNVKFESSAPASVSRIDELTNPIKKQTVTAGALTVVLDVPPDVPLFTMSIRLDCGSPPGYSTGTLYAIVSGPGGKKLEPGVPPHVDVASKVQLDGF